MLFEPPKLVVLALQPLKLVPTVIDLLADGVEVGEAATVGKEVGDFLERHAQALEVEDTSQVDGLTDVVVAVAGPRVDVSGHEQAYLLVVAQSLHGDSA